MNKQLDRMLQQRMDRKNFLKHIALGAVMMTGAAGILKALYDPNQSSAASHQSQQRGLGYGDSAYGGVKR